MEESKFANLPSEEILARGREIAEGMRQQVSRVVYGPEMQPLIDILITAVFADGHVIVRAPVGLAKTLTCEALSRTIGGVFHKRQFRPDMLPSELSGFEIFNQKTHEFETRHGPLHGANIFLGDEINRGTPKAQAALLEAMEELQITIGTLVYELEDVFVVLATRNPIEQEGTYQLPEAQLDRFFAQSVVDRISEETMMRILTDPDFWKRSRQRLSRVSQVTTPAEIAAIREAIFSTVHVEERLLRYIIRLVAATWDYKDNKNNNLVAYGSSPRGAINLKKAAMVAAFLSGLRKDTKYGQGYFVTPEDVRKYAIDVLAHRIIKKPEARFDPSSLSTREIVAEMIKEEGPHEVKFD